MAEDTSALWEQLVAEFGERNPYLEQARGVYDSDAGLVITVSNEWAQDRIEARYLEAIRAALKTRFPNGSNAVRVVVDKSLHVSQRDRDNLEEDNEADDFDAPTEIVTENYRREQRPRVLPAGEFDRSGNLNPRYTFDRFVVGSSNRFAFAAALSIAEKPDGKNNNPLFIYGGVGLGKTHLLHAIGNLVRSRNPNAKVLYVSAEQFTNDMVEAIRFNNAIANRNKYRTIDVLLMDDIQFLQKKAGSQIEFYNTFNELHNNNRPIILASDSLPKDIPELEERIRSRFLWGTIATLETPEVETRIAILQRKAEDMGYGTVPSSVATYIAEYVATNIRELEGALSTVYRFARLEGQEVTVDLVRKALRREDDARSSISRPITVDLIQRAVSDFYHMKPQELKAKRRTKRIATVRHIAMYLCRQMTDLSLVDIGQDFGGRDHSTVINAYAKIEKEIEKNGEIARQVEALMRSIREQAR
jgi:chromosomal replication initiator protein